MKNKFIILSGIPGQGKSTYAKKLALKENAQIICPDSLRKDVTGSEDDLSRDDYIWKFLVPERVLFWADKKENIIFDATQINRKARLPMIKRAQYIGYYIECHYMKPDVELAKKQNVERDRKVPDFVIDDFAKKWEIPMLDEGFDKIAEIN